MLGDAGFDPLGFSTVPVGPWFNGFEGRVHIINKMSTEVTPAELAPYGTPTVLLSEILGTLTTSESMFKYIDIYSKHLNVRARPRPEMPNGWM